jgi:hypothetical protein
LHAYEAAHARIAPLQFLGHQSIFHVAHAGAAITFQRRAEKSQVGHGFDQLAREASGAIAFLNDGNQVVFDELSRSIADEALFVGQQGKHMTVAGVRDTGQRLVVAWQAMKQE